MFDRIPNRRSRSAGVALLLLLAVAGFSREAPANPIVVGVRTGEQPSSTRFVLELSEAVVFRVVLLPDPHRVVIDLPEVVWKARAGEHVNRGLIVAMRFGLYEPGVSRVVLDVSKPVRVARSFLLPPSGNFPYRFVLDLVAVGPEDTQQSAALASPPVSSRRSGENNVPQPIQLTPPKQRKKPLIVLDPGHGGRDPGTTGTRGSPEKTITLAVATELARRLKASGRYQVLLTRTDDRSLRLRDRVAAARNANADLFISLHADSIKNSRIRGASVYTLSENASDKQTAALAEKENQADVIAGLDLDEQPDDLVRGILISLATRETMNYSAIFANLVLPELEGIGTTLANGHRFAGFAVLKAPDIPSLLIEMGYLSNRADEKLLLSPNYHARIAKALIRSIDQYFADLKS
jgi:N-acetylmuramoyl-L-alanine amidase